MYCEELREPVRYLKETKEGGKIMQNNYLKIPTGSKQEKAVFYYDFTCPACYNKILLGTDGGRYGNIGDFSCIHCGETYHATDDDAPSPNNLYVWSDKYGKTTLKETKK